MNRAILILGFWGVLNAAVACSGDSNDSGSPSGGAGGGAGDGAGAAQAGSSSGAGAGSFAGNSSGGAAGASAGAGNAAGALSNGGSTSNGGEGGLLIDLDPGPDPGSGSCMDFTPCGGNLLGGWQFDDECMSPPVVSNLRADCPAVQETRRLVGTLFFGDDGGMGTTSHVVTHAEVPASCVASLGGCGAPTGSLAACSPGPADSCICDTTSAENESERFYVASGDHVVWYDPTNPASPPQTVYYCRNNDRLLLRASTGTRIFVYQLTHL